MYTGREIAVIGMDGVFPKSKNVIEFWKNLKDGKELISFEKDDFSQNQNSNFFTKKDFISAHGTVNRKDFFDASFFKYLPNEAKIIDPQIRVFHEVVWHALEDAGVIPTSANDIGLYAGASDNILWKSYNSLIRRDDTVDPFLSELLCDKDRLSTLISYKLNLQGPSITMRTACSTSLVSVHMACRALLTGECNIAVAGGVSFSSNHIHGYTYREGMIFSSDGHTRTFDNASDGTIFSEGAGAVVLKRLNEAIDNRDNIHAIIKGSFVNNDGADKVSFSAPSIKGQARCIKMAHKISQISPDSISYVEAHGTATNLGDPIEIEALNKAFENSSSKSCYIGSVKSNMGHLGAAAGIAGLIKVILSLKNQELVPSINYKCPNSNIPFKDGPFKVISKFTKWPKNKDFPRRAGVSSFGIGGTNAHVVLEEWTQKNIGKDSLYKTYIFPFSAMTRLDLYNYIVSFVEYLRVKGEYDLGNLSYTLRSGRKNFEYRLALCARTKDELIEKLEKSLVRFKPKKRKKWKDIVFMFPGQGVQYFKMGIQLYETETVFKKELDRGFRVLKNITQIDFKHVLFEDEDNSHRVDDTKYTQPILFIFQYSLYKLLSSKDIKPNYLIGHSFGEYTSACISGVLDYEDTLKILLKRGALMDKLPEGKMLGVSTSAINIKKYLVKGTSLASINSPEQCIISGKSKAINELIENLKDEKIEHRLLNISFASHSSMIDLVLEEYRDFLGNFKFHLTKIPFSSNLTGELFRIGESVSSDYWCRHLRETVNFNRGIQNLDNSEEGRIFIDVGPGDALKRLFKQNKLKGSNNIGLNVIKGKYEETEYENDSLYFYQFICELWENGFVINWDKYFYGEKSRLISIPKYAFKKDIYPSTINLDAIISGTEFDKIGNLKNEEVSTTEKYSFKDNLVTNSELTEELIAIWKSFFGLDEVEINEDFFEYGGDSLKAMALIRILNSRFNIKFPIKIFFKNSSIVDLAIEIENILWIKDGGDKEYKNKLSID